MAALFALLFRFLKQPAILAYILTGILIGHFGFFSSEAQNALHSLAELGITLLLFMLGLEIKLKELPTIGKVAAIVGISQITITSLFAYWLSILLGFSILPAIYISIALTFSSTIIVVKLLSDKKDLHSLYGKIAVGVLLIQDLFAICILIFLSSFTTNSGISPNFLFTILLLIYKGLILFVIIAYLSRYILPRVLDFTAKSSETLFLFSLAWVFGIAAFVSSSYMGFSIEIGGFIAGLALSTTTENFQIAARMKTLRDFFIVLFFVVLGSQMNFTTLQSIIFPTLILSLFVLIIKPLIVMMGMGLMGYRKRTSFFTGLTMSQISEFSLIVVFMGEKIGHINGSIVSLVTIVGIITFTFSSYMIQASNMIYRSLQKYLYFLEKAHVHAETIGDIGELNDHIVLIGAHSMGESILYSLDHKKNDIVVVDFDPEVVNKLREKNIKSLFGDIADIDIQEKAQLQNARLVISTISDLEDNIILIKSLTRLNRRAKIVVIAWDQREAKQLYKKGADYVVIPYIAGGKHLAKILKENDLEKLEGLKQNDFFTFLG